MNESIKKRVLLEAKTIIETEKNIKRYGTISSSK